MSDGRWRTGASHEVVAKKFKVSPATVKDWATSASRIIRLAIEPDREELRARLVVTLEGVVARALKTKRPDLRNAIMAVAEQGKLLGLATSKIDVTTRPSVAHLSREEHMAELEKLRAEIVAEAERIRAEDAP